MGVVIGIGIFLVLSGGLMTLFDKRGGGVWFTCLLA